MMKKNQNLTIEEFISAQPAHLRVILQTIRQTIQKASPKAVESISYGIPTFDLYGKHLVHFSVFKHHVGFYPSPSGIEKFKKEITRYKWAKGSVQFPLHEPLPYNLIKKITLFRTKETLKSVQTKLRAGVIDKNIRAYNLALTQSDKRIAMFLSKAIQTGLPTAENKVWHGHPVWFLEGNPIVGYSKQKAGMRLMFWSGADFDEKELNVKGGKFKDASIFYTKISDIQMNKLQRWLRKSQKIQWDYKNIVKRKGVLVRLP